MKDEYTLGKKVDLRSDEKQFVPLDSVYERDFDQKFLMNKHNFEQVNQMLELQEKDDEEQKPVQVDEFYQMINS